MSTHALQTLAEQEKRYDLVVYLQPTSPLREASDILTALDFFLVNKVPSLVSVSPVVEHPLFMRTMENDGQLVKVLDQPSDARRQDLPPFYSINGAIYINHAAEVLAGWRGNDNQFGFVMDGVSGMDINIPEDLLRVEKLLQARGR